MKMHSPKFRDPLITLTHPVTMIVPMVEESLRVAGAAAPRDQILDRFMSGQPRIAVVHNSEDHPPAIGNRDTVRRTIRQVWAGGAIPFDVATAVPCGDLTHGHVGDHYALMSRNICAATLAAQMEAHGYDGAIVVGICDKMVVGHLRALLEADLVRQRRKARPVFAAIIPSVICREQFISEDDRIRFDALRARLNDRDRNALDILLRQPSRPQNYAEARGFIETCFQRKLLSEAERDELDHVLAHSASVPGASCSGSEASVVHRLILASMGLVPRHLDVAAKCPGDQQLFDVVQRLHQAITKRERRVSVFNLVRTNLPNAVSVWSATGSHSAWLLHLSYLADAVGRRMTLADMMKTASSVPQILAVDDAGHSAYGLAVEAESGGNSGVDTIMRTLSERRMVEDRSATLDGSWAQRITEARSANGNFLFSTMTPYAPARRLTSLQGNIGTSAVARVGGLFPNGVNELDRKCFLAVFYLGRKELAVDSAKPGAILERLKARIAAQDLYRHWKLNFPAEPVPDGMETWNKSRLWQYLQERRQVRIMVVVAGEGPHASGMPEVSAPLEPGMLLMTDGRTRYQQSGLSISQVVPEALDAGGISAVRTGDWILVDLRLGELNVVQLNRQKQLRPIPPKELRARAEVRKRVAELQRRSAELLPSIRSLLSRVSAADAGVSPSL